MSAVRPLRAPNDAMPVLSLRLARMGYSGSEVLGAMALDLAAGETLAITGPSGIGKTTLLRILAGLERRFEGTLTAPERRALVFQEPTLLPWRSLIDNLHLTAGVTREQAETALADVGLAGRGTLYPGQLSLGQQRRVSLARAFASAPKLLLMDEPFVSLDPGTADEMMALFERLRARAGVATILVTHAEAEAARLAARTLRLDGQPAQIVAERGINGRPVAATS